MGIVKAGMKIRATIMETSLIPEARLGLLKGGALRVCLAFDIVILPLRIDIIGFVELYLCPYFKKICAKLGFVKVCLPVRRGLPSNRIQRHSDENARVCVVHVCVVQVPFFFQFCPEFEITIFTWSAKPITFNIFTICNRPADDSPPVSGFVEAAQTDDVTIAVEWGDFDEPDGEIAVYTVCIGDNPGSQTVLECQEEGLSSSATYTDLVLPDGRKVYVTVIATNAEGLETGTHAIVLSDASAPEVYNVEIARTLDGEWVSGDWTYHNSSEQIRARFQVKENVATSNVSMIQYCVGTTPGDDDVAECNDIGYSEELLARSTQYFEVSDSQLDLEHGGSYFVSFDSVNHLGIREVFSSMDVYVDLTPPEEGVIVEHHGDVDDDPEYTNDPYTFKTRWEGFVDPESPVRGYAWSLVETLTGAPVSPLRHTGLGLSDWVTGIFLEDGVRYAVELQVQNEAGSWRVQHSSGVIADASNPEVRQILDLRPLAEPALSAFVQPPFNPLEVPIFLTLKAIREQDIDFVQELAAIRARWFAYDIHSGIVGLKVGVGTCQGCDNTMQCVSGESRERLCWFRHAIPCALPIGHFQV